MDFFAEKAHQISDDGLTAFGIGLLTRYGKADEMAEMLTFARLAAAKGLHELVKEVFYDSQANLCTIELFDDSLYLSAQGLALRDCAAQSLRQFQWDGAVHHGAGLLGSADS
ncbi:hypothetical protein [Polaromonas sp. CG_23.6]|uniref:hypothetical protein n=1 Tax=Polaromonas sp. CG_23.6 TaxID=2760709 RepID=UPI0024771717|nr:hypothetical protein [Polaromonas sp. CG_23.6]MDH6185509.1 hypothetical protein [Polaromonas sp. CG_23.6]